MINVGDYNMEGLVFSNNNDDANDDIFVVVLVAYCKILMLL